MGKINSWIKAARLKTLPLALSSPLMGSFLAWFDGKILWSVFILSTLTTLLLQILSNFANDYGDFTSGADNSTRIGPKRMLQSGEISPSQMRKGLYINIALALLSGVLLIYFGTKGRDILIPLIFLGFGIAAIVAAIKYTIGKNPYGYSGFGDLFVFIFFGIIGVVGTSFLHTGTLNFWHLLPASAVGLLSSGVLNLNNLRDYESDKLANKRTMVVWLGLFRAKIYHLALITISMVLVILFVLFNYQSILQFLFLITLPLFIFNVAAVFRHTDPAELYPELKRLALSTFIFTLIFGIGLII
jgi:1,4-dihydroxy-2-naphthoate octaprenyltransferase